MNHHMMKNFFNTDATNTILFSVWKTENYLELFLSCLFVFIISFSYEAVKAVRFLLLSRQVPSTTPTEVAQLNPNDSELKPRTSRLFSLPHLAQSLLYWAQIWLGILAMLVYMTFNVYLCLAISLGNLLGYFSIAWWSTNYVRKDLEARCC